MNWFFEINEISAGAYLCTGKRDTGNTVSTQCGEDEIFHIFKKAYELETEIGTLPSKALFAIVSGAKKDWASEYNDAAFGSWMVTSKGNNHKFVYDGKDFYLMIYGSSEKPLWQGYLKEKNDAQDSIFQFLIQHNG